MGAEISAGSDFPGGDGSTDSDLVVVGAGIAGLSLARELRALGRHPLVIERARGVGGRCATRRVEGQPVDHGPAFLHGRSDRFLAELAAARQSGEVANWPRVREGAGVACQPEAFDGLDMRIAPAAGVNRFAKHLAQGLELRLDVRVEAIGLMGQPGAQAERTWELALSSGERLHAQTLALAMPAPAVHELLRAMEPSDAAVTALLPLLELVHMLPCMTVIARYPEGVPAPAWDASYPGGSKSIQAILQDSSKRAGEPRLTLVIQARAKYSRDHLSESEESWTRALLEEAAALHGEWIKAPDLVQSHIWRNARVASGSGLASPLLAQLAGNVSLGIAGDGFHAAGGIEGAYLSGIALAARFPSRRIPAILDSR